MSKILTIFGTRPEAIKMIPVVRELTDRAAFEVKVCVTAQHRQMLDQVLDLFGIVPDHDLDVMRPGQSLTEVTAAVLQGLEPILKSERPDWVLVHGDTATTLATSLAAYYQRIRVGHVEAGLRTYDKYRPFPEEMNRRVTSLIADLHFAPTAWAADNLRREGIPEGQIVVTGNTVIDALTLAAALPFDPYGSPLAQIPTNKRLILVTAHRRENFGRGMEEICAGLRALSKRYEDIHLVYPVHLNPQVQLPVWRILGGLPNVTLLPPLDYQPFVWLLKRCHFVITDSGGLQEEAPGLGKPVLVLRDTTERPEGVSAGTVRLIGADQERLIEWAGRLLDDDGIYEAMSRALNPYGDGRAARQIADVLAGYRSDTDAFAATDRTLDYAKLMVAD